MKRKAESIYVDSHGFGFCYSAKKLMEENCKKFGKNAPAERKSRETPNDAPSFLHTLHLMFGKRDKRAYSLFSPWAILTQGMVLENSVLTSIGYCKARKSGSSSKPRSITDFLSSL